MHQDVVAYGYGNVQYFLDLVTIEEFELEFVREDHHLVQMVEVVVVYDDDDDHDEDDDEDCVDDDEDRQQINNKKNKIQQQKNKFQQLILFLHRNQVLYQKIRIFLKIILIIIKNKQQVPQHH